MIVPLVDDWNLTPRSTAPVWLSVIGPSVASGPTRLLGGDRIGSGRGDVGQHWRRAAAIVEHHVDPIIIGVGRGGRARERAAATVGEDAVEAVAGRIQRSRALPLIGREIVRRVGVVSGVG